MTDQPEIAPAHYVCVECLSGTDKATDAFPSFQTGNLCNWCGRNDAPVAEATARPEPPMREGWIEHDGGPCPVDPESRVEIKCRSGGTDSDKASSWWWGRDDDGLRQYEIIAYRPEPQP